MADPGKTVVYPVKGVTLYLPGGVHGFTRTDVGVPLRSDHADILVQAGKLITTPAAAAEPAAPTPAAA